MACSSSYNGSLMCSLVCAGLDRIPEWKCRFFDQGCEAPWKLSHAKLTRMNPLRWLSSSPSSSSCACACRAFFPLHHDNYHFFRNACSTFSLSYADTYSHSMEANMLPMRVQAAAGVQARNLPGTCAGRAWASRGRRTHRAGVFTCRHLNHAARVRTSKVPEERNQDPFW